MANINLGRVSPLAVGDYDNTLTYDKLDIVNYQGSSYIAKKSVPVGTNITNNEYWQLLAGVGQTGNGIASIAKTSTSGLVDTYTMTMTDGTTTTFTVTNASSGVWGSISGNIKDQTDLDALAKNHIYKPLSFNGATLLYNGSNSLVNDPTAETGYYYTGFDHFTTGSINNYAIVKEITKSQRIKTIGVGETIEFAVYAELIDGVDSVLVQMQINTSGSWNSNTQSFADNTNVLLVNGWNLVKLTGVAQASTVSDIYNYFIVRKTSNPYLYQIKGLYIYQDVNVMTSKYADLANYTTNAGWVTPEIPEYYNSNNFSTLGAVGTINDNSCTIEIPDATEAISGQVYGTYSFILKRANINLFGKGYKIKIVYENANPSTSPWKWSNVHISKVRTSWGTNAIANIAAPDIASETTEIYDLDSYGLDVSEISEVYFLIASFRGEVSAGAIGNTLKATVYLIPPAKVLATELLGFDQSDYYTKDEIDELIDGMSYDADMLFWGDSLTAGAGGNGTTYPGVCASELGLTYKNCGVGGENANTIAARQGGNTLIIPAGNINGDYAYTEFLDVFGGSVRPLRQGSGSASGADKIYINGQECSLSITQTSATSTDAVYTISGYTGTASDIPLLAKFRGSNFAGRIVVIWVGQNGSSVNGNTDINARIALIDSMISHIGHNRYVILGLSSGTETSKAAEDVALSVKYGNKFMPVRKLLVQYGLTINGLTATSQDETDIANGTVPTSLRYDNVHMNAYGYSAIGKLLADQIRALGYV